MGYLGVILAFAVLSFTLGNESCPPSSQISPCTCDREGLNCMAATKEEEIRKASLADYPFGGIQSVWIQGTPIRKVPRDLFGTLKALHFYIEMNEIVDVNMEAFDHAAEHIRILSFFGNRLSNFSFSSLETLPEIMIFNIGRNNLTSIPAKAFAHQALRTIILSQNRISTVGPNAFRDVPNLEKLEMSQNSLTTLGSSSMSVWPTAVGLQIFLNHNSISHISSTAFEGSAPQFVHLGYNRLTSLKQEAFSSLVSRLSRSGGVIDVSGNPLTCWGCDYRWILNNLQAYYRIIIGLVCPDGTGILGLTSFRIGC